VIGKDQRRLDSAGKVRGTAPFGIDVQVPGMKIATLAQSPVFGGKLAGHDDAAAARAVPAWPMWWRSTIACSSLPTACGREEGPGSGARAGTGRQRRAGPGAGGCRDEPPWPGRA
jgi:CO/xanthine dehydrogenase Mo-binding subunit